MTTWTPAGRKRPAGGPARRFAAPAVLALCGLSSACGSAWAQGDAEAGEAVFIAANCQSCHTDYANDGALLAGGRALKTPFGTFYSPNITPDPKTGIGNWSDEDFRRALIHGRAPDGARYYPVFPYTSYSGMTDQDVADLKAYIFSLPPVEKANRPHDLKWPFSWRWVMAPWQWLFFHPERFAPDPERDDLVNRGAYLVDTLGHCGECHTPRNRFGVLKDDMHLAGQEEGPEGGIVPNITPDPETGIGNWSDNDITWLLITGFLPDGDNVQGGMGEVVEHSTSRLTDTDRQAIAAYLNSLPPIVHQVGPPRETGDTDTGGGGDEFDY
ncbi:MAG: cytochrome C [Rhodospirillaceae bacterium]|nr:cytochrome C [Rhodospirillaceae bacterium]